MGWTMKNRGNLKIFAIGAPKGLVLTLSEGIISGFREDKAGRYLQISAPISPGSSGGGLFDEQGRLIGMPTFYLADSQQLNFAVPVEWIKDVLNGNISSNVTDAKQKSQQNSEQILLRCNGYKDKSEANQSPVIRDKFDSREQENITVVINKDKKTIRSDPPFFILTTNENGEIISKDAPYVEDEVSYNAILPKYMAIGINRGDGMYFGNFIKTYRIDRLTGELFFDIDVMSKGFLGTTYHRYRGNYKCRQAEDRIF